MTMKKIINGLMILVLGSVAVSALGAQPVPPPPAAPPANSAATRVGVLDMRQIMEKSSQIKQIQKKLQSQFLPDQNKLVEAQNALKNKSVRLRRDNASMKNNEREELEQSIMKDQQELQRMQGEFQQRLTTVQNKELKQFLDYLKGIIEKVASAENLSLVMTKDTVAYVKPNLDITNKVLLLLPHN
jgi:outer membrane protein